MSGISNANKQKPIDGSRSVFRSVCGVCRPFMVECSFVRVRVYHVYLCTRAMREIKEIGRKKKWAFGRRRVVGIDENVLMYACLNTFYYSNNVSEVVESNSSVPFHWNESDSTSIRFTSHCIYKRVGIVGEYWRVLLISCKWFIHSFLASRFWLSLGAPLFVICCCSVGLYVKVCVCVRQIKLKRFTFI